MNLNSYATDWRGAIARALLFCTLIVTLLFAGQAHAAIAYVQQNYAVPQTPQTQVTLKFTGAQTAGNLNVVAIGWNDATAHVVSVSDTSGNTYVQALSPTVQPGIQTHVIYYAAGIKAAAANSNTVTVSFDAAASYPDVRIAEYSGIDTATPVDVTVGASGTGATSNSGTLTTTNANDLLVAGNYVQTSTAAAGSGYTKRVITSPNGSILEDRTVTAVGTYSATASLNSSGGWVMQLVAFRSASSGGTTDTTPPTAPSGLAATAASSNQINLSWTASTDNVGVTNYLIERCQGTGCTSFAQIGTSTTTTYNDTGLAAATTYVYRVRATDAASNLSAYSGTASGTTQSAPAASIAFVQRNYAVPQTPQTQVGVAFTGAQTAGNLNVVVIGWNDATAHVVSVSDSSGNTYAQALSPTVQPGIQTHVIYYAAGIKSAAAGANTVTVNFDAAASYPDVRVAEYSGIATTTPVDVAVGASGTGPTSNSGTLTTTNANDLLVAGNYVQTSTGAAGSGYTNRVITSPNGSILEDRTVTATGTYSATATLNSSAGWVMQLVAFRAVSAPDTVAPSAPGGLAATAASSSQINLSWTASTDNVGVTGYLIERCQNAGCTSFTQIGTSTTTTYADSGLTGSTTYLYRVRATDAAGNLSGYSGTASATTSAAVSPPSAPGGLAATAASSTQISLSWTASTGTLAVTSYLVERCQGAGCTSFAQVGSSTSTTYSDTNLTPEGTYVYRVRAQDSGGNLSAYSSAASATTPADTQPPTAPGGLAASVISSRQINLSWTASTDNVGVSSYYIERCTGAGCTNFAAVASSATTSYNNTGLSASTTYQYRVRAADAAGNLSPYSGTVSGTTPAAPAAPPLSYVQSASAVPQSSLTTVGATFAGAQTAGNANVVIIGWFNSTSNVRSVTDTAGNSYALAAGPTSDPTAGTQAIYYAVNIRAAAAGANTVTVTFDSAAPYPDLRMAEYAGVDPANPVDGGIEGTGTGLTSSAGPVTAAWPYDLLVAGNYVTTRTAGPGGGFTRRVITDPNGSILEDRIATAAGKYTATATLTQTGSWVMQLLALRGASPPPPDTTPPTVSITAPAAGAVLSGTVTFSISATDPDSAVGGVQLQIDGLNVGIPTSSSPYSISVVTNKFANGAHTVSAYAWDPTRNIGTSASINVTFNNTTPGNPAQTGIWSGALPWPLVSIHLNLLPNGQVLAWDQFATGVNIPYLWDPLTSGFTPVPTNDGENLFCAGHVVLKDGRLLAAGGEINYQAGVANSHVGLLSGHIFDPATNTWSKTPDMAYGRWYPTLTTLPDGRVLTLVGETTCHDCIAAIPEIYDPVANTWTQLNSASNAIPWYPYTFVLPDGRVIVTGSAEEPMATQVLDVASRTWTTVDSRLIDGGSGAMYLPGKFLKSGTSTDTDSVFASTSNTYVLDMTAASPAWRATASMAFPRTYHVFTVLPDGNVLVTGGGRTTAVADLSTAVYEAELWSPSTETWTTLSRMNAPREYHQTAILLPDARVLVTGAGRGLGQPDPTDQLSGEVFSPPYLFKGPRPTITSAPTQLTYGQNFTVNTPDAARIAKVVLIHIGTMTHTFTMDQRYVPLTFTAGSGALSVTAPANANLAPPGYYMLFLVDTTGVPSVAQMLKF